MKRTDRLGRMGILFGVLGFSLFLTLPAAAAEKVRFLLNWIPTAYHAGFYVAMERGLYAKEGLQITVISGRGSGAAAKGVATGTAEVGLADSGAVVVGRTQGLPAKMVGTFFDRSPMVIFVLEKSGIRGPKDLMGRTLAADVGSAPRIVFPAFARANNIPVDSVKWLTITPAAEVPTLITGRADGIPTFSTVQPSFEKAARAQGEKVRMIWYADHGLDIYGLALISSDAWIRSQPAALRAFLKASYEGIRWAMERPSEGVDLFLKSHPTQNREVSLETWRGSQSLMVTPVSKRRGLGYMDPGKVQLTRDILSRYQGVKVPAATKDLYTNDFLPGIFPPR
ncbi:MAG: ABC transporter substrate-binding protein [Candidatus Tectomicrobia bacterium]|nr:ABC transporter substrate-binding protein [Candidatus Tectomicrobia bacterium]